MHFARRWTRPRSARAIGAVTAALGRLPIVNDFYAQLDALDLAR